MLNPFINIEICRTEDGEKIQFDFAKNVQINSGYEDIVDTAVITLPKRIGINSEKYNDISAFIKRGATVKIQLGYEEFVKLNDDGSYNIEESELVHFDGYVSNLEIRENEIRVFCEDAFWLFKQYSIVGAVKDIKLAELMELIVPKTSFITNVTGVAGAETLQIEPANPDKLKLDRKADKKGTYIELKGTDILPETLTTVADISIGDWEMKNNPSLLDVIKKLKDKFPFYGFVIPQHTFNEKPIIHVGFAFVDRATRVFSERRSCVFSFGRNITKSNLKFKRKEDIHVQVVATSILPIKGSSKTKKLTVEAGDSFGDTIKLNYYNITDESELKKLADEEIKRHKFTGFIGSFETFGAPIIYHGDRIKIEDEINEFSDDVNSEYRVKKVVYTSGVKGFKQIIHLDYRTDT